MDFLLLSCLVVSLAACHADVPQARDAAAPDLPVDMPEASLFGATASSYVRLAEGSVTHVGVRLPISAIEAAPVDAPFREDLVLDMPAAAKQQTFLSQLRVNWLAHGHGPAPYSDPHFDFHFFRGSGSEIDAIACDSPANFPPEILTVDHQAPSSCVSRMGYHAWPSEDAAADAAFTASLILGYLPTKLVFIEPMITRATLLQKRDFELPKKKKKKSGAAATRYPTRVRVSFQSAEAVVQLEFDRFVDLE